MKAEEVDVGEVVLYGCGNVVGVDLVDDELEVRGYAG